MISNRKFFALIILSVLIFSGCGFNNGVKTQPKAESWKKHCLDYLGIEFEYPASWSLYSNVHIFYLREGGNPGNIMMIGSGSFSDLEKEDIKNNDHIIDSKIIEINGIKVIERNYKPIEPKNTAAIKGYFFLTPTDKWVALMNSFSDRNADIFEKIAKSVKIVGDNGCYAENGNAKEEKRATTTVNEEADNYNYSLEADDKNPGRHIFKDKINGFVINYPNPLIYVKDAGSTPWGDIIFQVQFPYNEDGGGESADMAKMWINKYNNIDNKALSVVAEEVAKETAKEAKVDKILSCVIGGKESLCFNAKLTYTNEWLDNYLEKVFFENNGAIYVITFYSSGKIKDKFKDIFNQIESKIEFIK